MKNEARALKLALMLARAENEIARLTRQILFLAHEIQRLEQIQARAHRSKP